MNPEPPERHFHKFRCRDCGTVILRESKEPSVLEICDMSDRVVECWKVGEANTMPIFTSQDVLNAHDWGQRYLTSGRPIEE